MPIYRVSQSWTEVHYLSNTLEIEADNEDEARDEAYENMDTSYGDPCDSEFSSGSFQVDEVECVSGEVRKKGRILPEWF